MEPIITIGTMLNKISGKFIFTIFGASGDLAYLKLFPALFELFDRGYFEDEFYIIGYARSEMSREEFQNKFRKSLLEFANKEDLKIQDSDLEKLLKNVYYFQGSYSEIDSFKDYVEFVKEIGCNEHEQELFHFSVPPKAYAGIIENIAKVRTGENKGKVKLIVEKPFGEDLESAIELEAKVKGLFSEDQVYLIDHYLGKHAIRSILDLRKRNRILDMMFEGRVISNVQITALEELKVENRLNYYDHVGAVKDMFQSHILQLLSLVLLDLPYDLTGDSIAAAKEHVFNSLIFKDGIFGQYEDYCHRNNYTCSPFTETLFAGVFSFNKQDWFDVPILVRSGKAMDRKQTSVVIEFKPHNQQDSENSNRLIFEIAPNSGMKLTFENGDNTEIVTAQQLDCGEEKCMSSHGVLFLDAMRGDKEYFVSFRQAISAWKLTENFLEGKKVFRYKANQTSNKEMDELAESYGIKWIDIYG